MDPESDYNETGNYLLNSTKEECDLMHYHLQYLSDPFYKEPHIKTLITAMYGTVACVGALGNLMVISAVLRNAQMRTPRNYFIINLALSDFLMCILTVPFTLYYVVNQFWNLGSTACKIVASAQGVNIFVSTMSITAIGLDRYWVILFPTKTQQQRFVIMACFLAIWIFSFALAFPLFYATNTTLPLELVEPAAKCGIILFVCNENWEGMVLDRRAYSISSTVFQYVLPLTMLTFAYTRIIWRLENRMIHKQRTTAAHRFELPNTTTGGCSFSTQNNRRSVGQRQRRMNLLLICVVAFFAVCWLPLNLYNALLSFDVAQYHVVGFVACHVFGMTSACANPILYGVFNENFRTEFMAILTFLKIVPVCRYLRKKLTPVRRRSIETNSRAGGAVETTYTSAGIGTIEGNCSEEEIRETNCKHPCSSVQRISGAAPRSNSKNQKPRVARFKKLRESGGGPSPFLAVTPTIPRANAGVSIGNDVGEDVSCALNLSSMDMTSDQKQKSINGITLREQDNLDEAYQGNAKDNSNFISPGDSSEKSVESQLISEEKIPLFSGKATTGGGNLKCYMLNTHL